MTKREASAIGAALWEGIVNGEDDDSSERIIWNTALAIVNTTGMRPARAAAMGHAACLDPDECDCLASHAATRSDHF